MTGKEANFYKGILTDNPILVEVMVFAPPGGNKFNDEFPHHGDCPVPGNSLFFLTVSLLKDHTTKHIHDGPGFDYFHVIWWISEAYILI